VEHVDVSGENALHNAAARKDDLRYFKPLVEAGLDVNALTDYGISPLMMNSESNHVNAARYLLDNGADLNLKGQDGKTAVYFAVEYNSNETIQLLWERGADFSIESNNDPTIIHSAARVADMKTLKMLSSFQLSISNLHCVSSDGLTLPQTC
jgi:ankyrin repeat protein